MEQEDHLGSKKRTRPPLAKINSWDLVCPEASLCKCGYIHMLCMIQIYVTNELLKVFSSYTHSISWLLIYRKAGKTEISSLLVHSVTPTQPKLGKAEAGQEPELRLGLPCGWPTAWATSQCAQKQKDGMADSGTPMWEANIPSGDLLIHLMPTTWMLITIISLTLLGWGHESCYRMDPQFYYLKLKITKWKKYCENSLWLAKIEAKQQSLNSLRFHLLIMPQRVLQFSNTISTSSHLQE